MYLIAWGSSRSRLGQQNVKDIYLEYIKWKSSRMQMGFWVSTWFTQYWYHVENAIHRINWQTMKYTDPQLSTLTCKHVPRSLITGQRVKCTHLCIQWVCNCNEKFIPSFPIPASRVFGEAALQKCGTTNDWSTASLVVIGIRFNTHLIS